MPILQKVSYMTAMQMARNGNPVSRHDWLSQKQPGGLPPMIVYVASTENLKPKEDTPYTNFKVEELTIKEHFDKLKDGRVTCGWKASFTDINSSDWYAVYPDDMEKKYNEFKEAQAKKQAEEQQKQLDEEANKESEEDAPEEVQEPEEVEPVEVQDDPEPEEKEKPKPKPKAKPKAKTKAKPKAKAKPKTKK